MSNVDHLAKAKDYIAKGEDYYRKAAEEITAAMAEDPTLGYGRVAKAVGKSDTWCADIVQWHTNPKRAAEPTPYSGKEYADKQSLNHAKRIARNRPEEIAAAMAAAPPEAQRKIADAVVKSSVDPSLKDAVKPSAHKPRQPKNAEQKLGDAVFALWEVGEILMDAPPTDAAKVRIAALAEKAQRLSNGLVTLLDTGEFEDEFRDLVEEMSTS